MTHLFMYRSRFQRLKDSFLATLHSIPEVVFPLFSTSIFFLQFLQWYSSYEQTEQRAESHLGSVLSVAPPKVENTSSQQFYICGKLPVIKVFNSELLYQMRAIKTQNESSMLKVVTAVCPVSVFSSNLRECMLYSFRVEPRALSFSYITAIPCCV